MYCNRILYIGIVALLLKSTFICARSVSGGSKVSSVSSESSKQFKQCKQLIVRCYLHLWWYFFLLYIKRLLREYLGRDPVMLRSPCGPLLCVRVTSQDGYLNFSSQHLCYWPLWKIIFLHPSWSTSLYLLTQNTVDWWCNHYNGGVTYTTS